VKQFAESDDRRLLLINRYLARDPAGVAAFGIRCEKA